MFFLIEGSLVLTVEAEPEAAPVAPRPVVVSGKAGKTEQTKKLSNRVAIAKARLAERYGKKPPKAAVEAWS